MQKSRLDANREFRLSETSLQPYLSHTLPIIQQKF